MATLDEWRRLEALRSYEILDTPPEENFDRLTRLGSALFGAPVCLISLIDQDRQWFKSRLGITEPETPRDLAFCAHAIQTPEHLFIVSDTHTDDRFSQNALVTGPPYIRYYAGAPLVGREGQPLGTFCVIDHQPRPQPLPPDKMALLHDLSMLAVTLMEARRERKLLLEAERRLHRGQSALEDQLRDRDRRIRELEAGVPHL